MAASSGGLLGGKKDKCPQFSTGVYTVAYLQSLNCLVGTTTNGCIEVLDIHSGNLLRRVALPPGSSNFRPILA